MPGTLVFTEVYRDDIDDEHVAQIRTSLERTACKLRADRAEAVEPDAAWSHDGPGTWGGNIVLVPVTAETVPSASTRRALLGAPEHAAARLLTYAEASMQRQVSADIRARRQVSRTTSTASSACLMTSCSQHMLMHWQRPPRRTLRPISTPSGRAARLSCRAHPCACLPTST